jgi:UDP-glucose 4-epimerase
VIAAAGAHVHPARIAGSAIVVTGGCGFIGSHLVRRLLELRAERVVVIDSLRYGDPANLGDRTAAVEVVRHQLGTDDPLALRDALRGARYLFHLAAEKHSQSRHSPLDVLRSNVDGTYALFDAAAQCGVEKIVFASSLYAYGRLQGPPFREDELPQPRTVYGISKLCGEHFLRSLRAEHGVPYNVLRYLFVYGPRQFAGMGYKSVIVRNFERLRDGEPPTVYGDGMQTLDYVFVDDAVEAAVRALETDVSDEVFNVGSGQPTTVNALIDLMLTVAKSRLPKRYEPADWTAGTARVGDVNKARTLLGWVPRTALADGLARTFQWIAERRRS